MIRHRTTPTYFEVIRMCVDYSQLHRRNEPRNSPSDRRQACSRAPSANAQVSDKQQYTQQAQQWTSTYAAHRYRGSNPNTQTATHSLHMKRPFFSHPSKITHTVVVIQNTQWKEVVLCTHPPPYRCHAPHTDKGNNRQREQQRTAVRFESEK